ncbi:GNAT family N-acetyltransferase [Geobacter sp. FeAm09]|uniref:GNAT family N-acetyltransferase n=1 Tax=Geobacter sp. FeAm09 TaxID=2597769 RepID=UPI00197B04F0|nr:GNAT family N-acetyltransferase [Geobacter sp. FeAm09]
MNRSFDEYLLKFSKKARYNLKREIKLLGTSGNGELSLVRVEHAADVALFLDGASQISSRSWQHALGPQMVNSPEERLRYERFAGQGVLRCYLLKCGERPCAFVRGFQFGDVFYYSRTGFDQNFSGYSPGRAMFCLLLEDLYTHRPPKRLNFQEGEYEYKRHFATGHVEQADMLLVRNDAGGLVRLAVSAHNAFGRSISLAKRIMHRQ